LSGAGLADPRFAGKHDETPLAGKSIVQGRFQRRHFLLAANEDAGIKRDKRSSVWSRRWLAHDAILTRKIDAFHRDVRI
jgi:hypothetical protein